MQAVTSTPIIPIPAEPLCSGNLRPGKRDSLRQARKGLRPVYRFSDPAVVHLGFWMRCTRGSLGEGCLELKKTFVGHTIGIEAREFPFELGEPKKLASSFLPETTDIPLEPNMVVNIEVALVELGFGGIQIEHTLVLKNGGFEFIVPQERELIQI